jgi:hypothetical protein
MNGYAWCGGTASTAGDSGYCSDSGSKTRLTPKYPLSTITASACRAGRGVVCNAEKLFAHSLVLLTISSLFSAQTGTAVLYGTGAVYVNGASLSNSSTVTVWVM